MNDEEQLIHNNTADSPDVKPIPLDTNTGASNMKLFEDELENLINRYSIENYCDIPDFLLAKLITNLIETIGETSKATLDWHGTDSVCHPNLNKGNN